MVYAQHTYFSPIPNAKCSSNMNNFCLGIVIKHRSKQYKRTQSNYTNSTKTHQDKREQDTLSALQQCQNFKPACSKVSSSLRQQKLWVTYIICHLISFGNARVTNKPVPINQRCTNIMLLAMIGDSMTFFKSEIRTSTMHDASMFFTRLTHIQYITNKSKICNTWPHDLR